MPFSGEKKRAYNRRYYRERQAQTARRGDKKILVSFRAPESLIARLDRLLLEGVAGKIAFPWKTRGNMFVGLLIAGLEHWKAHEPAIEELIPYLTAQSRITGMRTQRQEAYALLAITKDEIQELLAIGAEVEAKQVYHVAMEAVRQLPRTIWNDHLVSELTKAFPQLVIAGEYDPPGVSVAGQRLRTS